MSDPEQYPQTSSMLPRGMPSLQRTPTLSGKARVSMAPPAPQRAGEHVSQALKDHITEMALGLLEEQTQARIVHYRADLETNPELDAVTAEVVAHLKELQASATSSVRTSEDREAIRASHLKTLRKLLDRVFRANMISLLVEQRLKQIHRNLARLFFQSELHEKTRGQDGSTKVIQHGEQAIFYLLMRYQHRLQTELGGFDFASEEIRERSFDLLNKLTKDMQDIFLSRRSSELKRLISVFHAVLVDFFSKALPGRMHDFADEIIRQSRSDEGKAFAYKIASDAFVRFRVTFERLFMTNLVGYAEDQLVARLADTAGAVREETIEFITDPQVFSMICREICDGLYEFLCNEGFLDLPTDWRMVSSAPPSG